MTENRFQDMNLGKIVLRSAGIGALSLPIYACLQSMFTPETFGDHLSKPSTALVAAGIGVGSYLYCIAKKYM